MKAVLENPECTINRMCKFRFIPQQSNLRPSLIAICWQRYKKPPTLLLKQIGTNQMPHVPALMVYKRDGVAKRVKVAANLHILPDGSFGDANQQAAVEASTPI